MVGKAEHLSKGANPRFMVTNIPTTERAAKELYEQNDCGRGEMENRIKEQQLCLFADRMSCKTLRANQLRHWLTTLAYDLLNVLRERGLQRTRPRMFGTPLASCYQQFSGTKTIIFWHANCAGTLREFLSCPSDTASDDCGQGCQTI